MTEPSKAAPQVKSEPMAKAKTEQKSGAAPRTEARQRVCVVAPARRLERETADAVSSLCAARYEGVIDLHFHEQCFAQAGHFAGSDKERCDAFVDAANDPSVDVIWFARGGYGSGRFARSAVSQLNEHASAKTFIGYSDTGFLLAALDRAGVGTRVHGPMPADILRDGGEAAVHRTLDFISGDYSGLEPQTATGRCVALNLTVLTALCASGTPPNLTGATLIIEEVSEHLYAIDRSMSVISNNPAFREIKGLRLGRISDVPENDIDFGETAEEIVRRWCMDAHIDFLGAADIGHDAHNKIVAWNS
ncbi:MAG: LD-carboxypeptidase [Pseudomonadota bacterium]